MHSCKQHLGNLFGTCGCPFCVWEESLCEAGLRILQQGGTAADACVAAAAALNVTEPCNTGLGARDLRGQAI